MIHIPSFIPVNTEKIKKYISKKYDINIHIDSEFIEEVLDDNYDFHVYKRGKKKNTIEFRKTKNKEKIRKNRKLKHFTFDDNSKNINLSRNNNKLIKEIKKDIDAKREDNIRYIITKHVKCRCYEKNKEIIYMKNKYEFLNYSYNILSEKHKNTFNILKSLTLGLKKIYKEMNKFEINDNNINFNALEYKKMIYFIEKIIPNNLLINNLNNR